MCQCFMQHNKVFLSPSLVISRFQRFKAPDSVGKMMIVPDIDDKFNSYSKVLLLCLFLSD